MAVVKVEIVDTAFAHAPGMSWYHKPAYIEWVRGQKGDTDVCFFTDRSIGAVPTHSAKRKVAIIIEPCCVDDVGMRNVITYLDQLDYVLAYDNTFQNIVHPSSKLLKYPIGGCWIELKDQHLNHLKTNLVSLVASHKNWAPGHKLRHILADLYKGRMDLWGKGYTPVNDKATATAPYMFSVAIENDVVDDLFTEKLIDCLITGTVPIYWGTSAISNYFNTDGFLIFKTPEEFHKIFDSLSPDLYLSMIPAIKDNYARALEYKMADDWIFRNYPFLFT